MSASKIWLFFLAFSLSFFCVIQHWKSVETFLDIISLVRLAVRANLRPPNLSKPNVFSEFQILQYINCQNIEKRLCVIFRPTLFWGRTKKKSLNVWSDNAVAERLRQRWGNCIIWDPGPPPKSTSGPHPYYSVFLSQHYWRKHVLITNTFLYIVTFQLSLKLWPFDILEHNCNRVVDV